MKRKGGEEANQITHCKPRPSGNEALTRRLADKQESPQYGAEHTLTFWQKTLEPEQVWQTRTQPIGNTPPATTCPGGYSIEIGMDREGDASLSTRGSMVAPVL